MITRMMTKEGVLVMELQPIITSISAGTFGAVYSVDELPIPKEAAIKLASTLFGYGYPPSPKAIQIGYENDIAIEVVGKRGNLSLEFERHMDSDKRLHITLNNEGKHYKK